MFNVPPDFIISPLLHDQAQDVTSGPGDLSVNDQECNM